MIRKLTVGLLSGLICLLGVAGASIAAGAQEKITLKFDQWYYSDPNVAEVMDWYINDFEQRHPNVEIIPSAITGNYWDKMPMSITSNTEGDIVGLDTGDGMNAFHHLRLGGTFINLDDYIKGCVLEDGTFLERDLMLMDQMKRDGHYIALPYVWFVAVNTAYRKSHLKDTGVSVEDLKTWKGFKEGAEKLTRDFDGDGKIDCYGFGHPVYPGTVERWWHMHWLWTAGGGIFPNEKSPYTVENLIFNSPENLFAVEYLKDLIEKVGPPGNRQLFELFPMFEKGEMSMVHTATWTVQLLKKGMEPKGSYETDLGFFPFPGVNYKGEFRQPVYVGWGNPLAISSNCKHPDMAFKFIAYTHSKEPQRRLSTWALPVNKSVLATSFKTDFPDMSKFVEMSRPFELRIAPDIIQWNEFNHIIQQAMNTALLGLKSPQEALDWGQAEMAKALSR